MTTAAPPAEFLAGEPIQVVQDIEIRLSSTHPVTDFNATTPDRYPVRTMGKGADLPSAGKLPKRVPFRGDEHVGLVAEEAAVKRHPLYIAAKGGSTVAAARLVSELMGAAWLAGDGAEISASAARLVGVHAIEVGHTNPIGALMADRVGYKLDLPVGRQMFQVNEVGHTGAPGWHRLRSQALFAGSVAPGATYWLLDDFIGHRAARWPTCAAGSSPMAAEWSDNPHLQDKAARLNPVCQQGPLQN